jgi:vacuolar-type H+-ATPase subunit D/Vma8
MIVTLDILGEKLDALIMEVRATRAELTDMRAEIDGGFHTMCSADDRIEYLRRIVDAHGQRITALERKQLAP